MAAQYARWRCRPAHRQFDSARSVTVPDANHDCSPENGDYQLWRKFLAKITKGDAELQAFLQRVAGYALTGSIRKHALFFTYGTGGNGKGTFINTSGAILASYPAIAPMETFIMTQANGTRPTSPGCAASGS
jgi:putative DNA primase/helicase